MIENIRKNEKGITLAMLALTIIILIIITSITVKYGREAIEITNLQNMKTNMLLIEAKAKEYVENANHDLGVKPEEATQEMKNKSMSELKGTALTDGDINMVLKIGIPKEDLDDRKVYKLSTEDLEEINIKGVESNDKKGWYVVVYDVQNANAKVYNTYGAKLENGEIKYALDDIRDEF